MLSHILLPRSFDHHRATCCMTETTLALGWLLAPRHHGRVEEGVPDLHIRRMHQARQDGAPQVQETWHLGVFLLLAGVLQRQLGTAQGPEHRSHPPGVACMACAAENTPTQPPIAQFCIAYYAVNGRNWLRAYCTHCGHSTRCTVHLPAVDTYANGDSASWCTNWSLALLATNLILLSIQ